MCEGMSVALTGGVPGIIFGVVVSQVSDSRLPVDEELTLACAIAYSKKTHVDRFQSFLFDGVVGKAVGVRVVNLDWNGRLWVTYFEEQDSYWDGLLSVDVGSSDFGFGGQTYYV